MRAFDYLWMATEKRKEMAKSDKKKTKRLLPKGSYDFLRKYIDNASPTGFEWSGQKLWLDYIKPWTDTQFTDPYGSAAAVVNPEAPFKVVIEAHADEISWFVNYITPEGLIYLKRNGGVDHQVAPAKRVVIHGRKGPVKAVFGWPLRNSMRASEFQKPTASTTPLRSSCCNVALSVVYWSTLGWIFSTAKAIAASMSAGFL